MNFIKVLLLTANPSIFATEPLRLEAEVRQVKKAIQRSQHGNRYKIELGSATRPKDLRRALIGYKPHIVHFSGHGSKENGLILENDTGKPQFLSTQAILHVFQISEFCEIDCVLLNACYSEEQAIAIHQVVDCVIGMNQAISDTAALFFSEGFYDALGSGLSYEEAYRSGCSAISSENSSDYDIPKLLIRRRRKNPLSSASASQSLPSQQLLPAQSASSSQAAQSRPAQSQNFEGMTISGNNNALHSNQSGGDITISYSSSQLSNNQELQAALVAIEKLKQAVQTSTLGRLEKGETELRIKMLAEELQKPQFDKAYIEEVTDALRRGASGAAELDSSITQISALTAKLM